MAFTAANLALISSVNGFGLYRYDSTDTIATIIIDGYIDNDDDVVKLGVGDMIHIYQWTTAVRTGVLADVGIAVVLQVETDGTVHLSNDLLAATVTYT